MPDRAGAAAQAGPRPVARRESPRPTRAAGARLRYTRRAPALTRIRVWVAAVAPGEQVPQTSLRLCSADFALQLQHASQAHERAHLQGADSPLALVHAGCDLIVIHAFDEFHDDDLLLVRRQLAKRACEQIR